MQPVSGLSIQSRAYSEMPNQNTSETEVQQHICKENPLASLSLKTTVVHADKDTGSFLHIPSPSSEATHGEIISSDKKPRGKGSCETCINESCC